MIDIMKISKIPGRNFLSLTMSRLQLVVMVLLIIIGLLLAGII